MSSGRPPAALDSESPAERETLDRLGGHLGPGGSADGWAGGEGELSGLLDTAGRCHVVWGLCPFASAPLRSFPLGKLGRLAGASQVQSSLCLDILLPAGMPLPHLRRVGSVNGPFGFEPPSWYMQASGQFKHSSLGFNLVCLTWLVLNYLSRNGS